MSKEEGQLKNTTQTVKSDNPPQGGTDQTQDTSVPHADLHNTAKTVRDMQRFALKNPPARLSPIFVGRANEYVDRFLRETGQKDAPIEAFAEWLNEKVRPHVKPTTWRMMRSIMHTTFRHERLHELIKKPGVPQPKGQPRTCAQRRKCLPQKDLDKLTEVAMQRAHRSGSKTNEIVLMILRATLHTGLRPHEWKYAKISEDQNYLVVQNNKLKKCVPDWTITHRKVPISHLDEATKKDIMDTLAFMHRIGKDEGKYTVTMETLTKQLHDLSRAAFPRRKYHITFMSARHNTSPI